MVLLNHGHLYLLLGRRLRVGGDDHVDPGMASSPGKGVEGGLRNQEKYLWEFFFTSSGFPTVTCFDKKEKQ